MHRRRLGQLEVSAIGLGCGTMTPFYGEPDRAAGIATIRRAREIGVDLLDTADGYGQGRNEELVAEAVREHRGDYVIASKFGNLGLLGDPRFADGRPEYVREACEKSLGRLKTDVIDLYYIHRVDQTVPIEDTIGAMSKLFEKTGWSKDEVDLYEINEAFAVVTMAAMRDLALPHDKVNVNGGACALGHPIGASGAHIIVTLLAALEARGLERGVASLCIGGGEATAIAVERVH